MYICYDESLADKFTPRRLRLIAHVNAVIADYQAQGYTLSLRQIYYQLVQANIIPNEERSYKNLGNAVTDGRMAGMISWDAIEDRVRGIRPWLIQETEVEALKDIEYGFALDLWERQNVYCEVLYEKDAISGIVRKACQEWRVPYMPTRGYLSASEAWRTGRRFMEHSYAGRRCVLIYLGDHDPSGIDMTRDVDDRVDIFGEGSGVEIRRIALNWDQIEAYKPPENPAKLSDTRSGYNGPDKPFTPGSYCDIYGMASWEVDALNPRTLHQLIEAEITSYIDDDIWDATLTEETERRDVCLSHLYSRYEDVSAWLNRSDD